MSGGGWSAAQRGALIGACALAAALAAVRLARHPLTIDDPQPPRGARADALADRIDPNTADEAALAALPLLGPRRAADIVAYRQRHLRSGAVGPAFRTPFDLLRVRGIGEATMRQLEPSLRFPGDATTVPTAR